MESWAVFLVSFVVSFVVSFLVVFFAGSCVIRRR